MPILDGKEELRADIARLQAELDAANADRERLREALADIVALNDGGGSDLWQYETAAEDARAALATPSDGGGM